MVNTRSKGNSKSGCVFAAGTPDLDSFYMDSYNRTHYNMIDDNILPESGNGGCF